MAAFSGVSNSVHQSFKNYCFKRGLKMGDELSRILDDITKTGKCEALPELQVIDRGAVVYQESEEEHDYDEE